MPFLFRDVYALTMDVIATTAFGITIDAQTNPDSPYIKHALALIGEYENVNENIFLKAWATVIMFIMCEYGW